MFLLTYVNVYYAPPSVKLGILSYRCQYMYVHPSEILLSETPPKLSIGLS